MTEDMKLNLCRMLPPEIYFVDWLSFLVELLNTTTQREIWMVGFLINSLGLFKLQSEMSGLEKRFKLFTVGGGVHSLILAYVNKYSVLATEIANQTQICSWNS